jgi:hypothetical protein
MSYLPELSYFRSTTTLWISPIFHLAPLQKTHEIRINNNANINCHLRGGGGLLLSWRNYFRANSL